MAGLVLQHMAIGLRRGADIAGGEGLVGRGQHFLGMVVAAMAVAAGQLLHEGLDLAFGDARP